MFVFVSANPYDTYKNLFRNSEKIALKSIVFEKFQSFKTRPRSKFWFSIIGFWKASLTSQARNLTNLISQTKSIIATQISRKIVFPFEWSKLAASSAENDKLLIKNIKISKIQYRATHAFRVESFKVSSEMNVENEHDVKRPYFRGSMIAVFSLYHIT